MVDEWLVAVFAGICLAFMVFVWCCGFFGLIHLELPLSRWNDLVPPPSWKVQEIQASQRAFAGILSETRPATERSDGWSHARHALECGRVSLPRMKVLVLALLFSLGSNTV